MSKSLLYQLATARGMLIFPLVRGTGGHWRRSEEAGQENDPREGESHRCDLVMMEKKLVGYDFYRSIGSPQRVVAPMVDHSDLAYRMMCRKYGAELVYTQMFSANCFIESAEYRRSNFQTTPDDRPLIVQFCGHNPQTLLQAALYVQDQCDAVDLNIGCPQGIAKRGHYGAFLMEDLDLLAEIVRTLSRGLKIPVTCKSRIYKDFDRTIKLYETLVEAGASMITIHGRTREQKQSMTGECDWDMIRRVREHFAGRVPILANGGIEHMGHFYRCLEFTGVDGIMTSEGILEDPALFSRPIPALPPVSDTGVIVDGVEVTASTPNQMDIAFEYLDFCERYPTRVLKIVRSHLMKYLYRYFDAHPQYREYFGNADSIEEFRAVCQVCRAVVFVCVC